jgi:RHS repeat-associated protein
LAITDRDGTVQTFTYDKLNRRIKEQWKDASGNITRSITSTYNAAGELVQISDPDSSYRYTYDRDGRMVTVSNQDTPNVPTTDNVGNVLSMTDSINGITGITTSHQFDALNRLTQNAQGNKRVDYAYNALSQVTNKKRYSDTTGTNLVAETTHTYDGSDRLTDITHSKGVNVLANYTQAYDAKSRITGVTGTDGSSDFTYDSTDQLTGVDYSFQTDESYTYDDNGNRTNAGYVTGVNNRLLEDNKFRYEYDLVGNRTKRTDKTTNEVTNYSWDVRDRLTGLVVKNALGEEVRSAGYAYDVYNQRIAKTVDMDGAGVQAPTTERYVYGGDQNIDLIFDENGDVSHRYLFGAGVDQIEADESGGSVLWALTDHLGSVRDVVDNSGVVQNHIVYDAFGGVTSQSNSSVVFRYGYTARELDAESGLQYNRTRYLDSFNGRFISEDPINFAGGDANLYRYVGNSPVTRIDPSGLSSRELTALFLNSRPSLNSRSFQTLFYNTIFLNTSQAYAVALAWFDQITIGLLNYPQNNNSGSVVFRNLKDDRGQRSYSGKATLRSFSSGRVAGSSTIKSIPTIDLKPDDLKNTHETLGYEYVQEVKFDYIKKKDDDDPDCVYVPQSQAEEDERRKARILVRNTIAGSLVGNFFGGYTPSIQVNPAPSNPQFSPPNIDFADIFKGLIAIPGKFLEELGKGY